MSDAEGLVPSRSSPTTGLLLLLTALATASCSRAEPTQAGGAGASPTPALATGAAPADPKPTASKTARKIIRHAELGIEVDSLVVAESKVSRTIQRLGGHIESSERAALADEGERAQARVALSLRVPAERLDEALGELKRLGTGAETERIGSEDVTEEYIDVEARVRNQRHLEEQLTSLLTRAPGVESALKIHQELTSVRTEIDRLEGRRRWLENEAALAKISLSLTPRRPVVAPTSREFGVSLRRALADGVTVSAAVATFAIRSAGVLAPLSLMFGAPVLGLRWWLGRRRRRLAAASPA